MLITLLSSFAVFTFFFVTLVWQRYSQALLEEAHALEAEEREERR